MTFEHFAAVPGPDDRSLAVVDGRLPSVSGPWRLPEVLAAFEPLIGRPTYLRIARNVEAEPERRLRLHVFDTGGAGDLVPIEAANLDELVPAALRPALADWLAELGGKPAPALRAAWARPGWYAEAEAWFGGPLEPVRMWPLSAVLRSGDTYFKAVFRLFHHEPAITAALARAQPELVPRVLRTDAARGWFLMEAASGVSPNELPAYEWGPVLRTLGEIHRHWSARTDELLELGAQDRRVGATLPETLVHGDFNPGNAFIRGDSAVIFDWSDACVADPLFDVVLLLFWVRDEAARETLLDAYAAGWAGEVSAAEIRAALAESEPLAYEHQARSYREIEEALPPDDRWWFAGEEARWRERASAARAGRRPSRDT